MNYQELLKNPIVRYVGILVIGVVIGAVFYPTKTIEEKFKSKSQEEIQYLKEEHQKEITKLKETYNESTKSSSQTIASYEKKVSKLSEELKNYQSKQKTSYYKLIKPDGTIEIKKFSESEVNESTKVVTKIQEEFNTKITQIENKWSEIHKERVSQLEREYSNKEQQYILRIQELEKSKVVKINEKSTTLEIGMNTDTSKYLHGTHDLAGPIFMGLHGEQNKEETKGGLGIGLRF